VSSDHIGHVVEVERDFDLDYGEDDPEKIETRQDLVPSCEPELKD
jgi:acyl carrier protein